MAFFSGGFCSSLFFCISVRMKPVIVLVVSLVFLAGCTSKPVKSVNTVSLTPPVVSHLPDLAPAQSGPPVAQSSYNPAASVQAAAHDASYESDGVFVSSHGSGPEGRLAPAVERVLYFGSSADGSVLRGPSREYVKLRESGYVEPVTAMQNAHGFGPGLGQESGLSDHIEGNVDSLGSGAVMALSGGSIHPGGFMGIVSHSDYFGSGGLMAPASVPGRGNSAAHPLLNTMSIGVSGDEMLPVPVSCSGGLATTEAAFARDGTSVNGDVVTGVSLYRVLSGSSRLVHGMFYPLGIGDSGLGGMYCAQDLIAGSGAPQGGVFLYESAFGGWGYFLPN